MDDKVYVVVINCGDRIAPNSNIERAINSARDWLRFSQNVYFIRSGFLADYWYDVIKPLLHVEDQLLVIEANEQNRKGWVFPLALEWFTTRRAEQRAGL